MEDYAPMLRNIRVDVCATSAAEIGVGDAPASRGGSRLPLIQHVETYDEALFHAIAAQDFEGIVAKRVTRPWPPRRAGKAQFRRRRSSPGDAVRSVGFALAPIRKRRRQDAGASAPATTRGSRSFGVF
jgi:hypothetical protein